LARNDPPTVLQRGGVLTRLRVDASTGAPRLEPLTDDALRGVLARAARWYQLKERRQGPEAEEDAPPLEVVKDLANLPEWPGVPIIDTVIECPAFDRTGVLVATPGFHPVSRLWYRPAKDLQVPPVPAAPSAAEVVRARDWLAVELLGDFPFQEEASKAHALAALLLPFVRLLIDGPTPLHLFDAPTEGTGKTLLAKAITLVAIGREAESMAEGTADEEWRKRITAMLAGGPTFVLLDNVNRALDSGALASALTTTGWTDRILGLTKMATLPNTAVWLASGNNTTLSRELIRRTLWCRLDAKVEAPHERRGFRHPNLLRWAKEHRGELVAAALTLAQAWLAAGRPPGPQTLGMFESWAEVIGGILEVAGVPGLLGNAQTFRGTRADRTGEWRAFILAWWQRYGTDEVGVEELFTLVTQDHLLDSVLGEGNDKSQRSRLGRALVRAAERVVGGFRLERAKEDHKGRQRYRLEPVAVTDTAGPAASAPEPAEEIREWSA